MLRCWKGVGLLVLLFCAVWDTGNGIGVAGARDLRDAFAGGGLSQLTSLNLQGKNECCFVGVSRCCCAGSGERVISEAVGFTGEQVPSLTPGVCCLDYRE